MGRNYPVGYCMPVHLQEYPPPPYVLGAIQGAYFVCTASNEDARSLVPLPLVVNNDNSIWVYVAHMTIVEPINIGYHEVGIFVPVTHDGQPGFFSVALFLDRSLPITIGREIWGFPKKFADSITIHRNGDRCSGGFVHDGEMPLEFACRISANETRLEGGETNQVYTHRIVPSWEPGKPSVNQIIGLDWIPRSEVRFATEDVELRVSYPPESPLGVLNGVDCVECWYSESDGCTLKGGRVIHDFLRQS